MIPPVSKAKTNRIKDTISFRLRPSFMTLLQAMAEERKEQSPDDLARKLVIDALVEQGMRGQVEAVHEQLTLFREDLVTAVAYVLQLTGKFDPKEARRSAEQLFRDAARVRE